MVNKSANISSGNNRSRSRCKNRNTEPSGNDSSQNRVTSSRRSPCRCTNPRLIGLSRTRVTPMRFSPITTANASTQARERHQSPRSSLHTDRMVCRSLLQQLKGLIVKIVVIGGSGLIGSKLVKKLREHGHEAVAASPDSRVNTLTGEGLAEALRGASVVVDVSNSPSFEDAAVLEFFETSTRNLLTYEAAAGVGHHVALSVVGTERLSESGYFRAKIAQEALIEKSPIPYSIVHATQFYEFVDGIADLATEGNTVRLP